MRRRGDAKVASLEEAQAFVSDPAAAEAGKLAGVLNGEYHFLETCAGYKKKDLSKIGEWP